MFTSYCFSTKIIINLYQKGWQFSCHLKADRNVKDLSPENVYLILFKYENKCVSLYQKGWQFSCHLVIGRNVKDLSLENVHFTCFSSKISVNL